MSQPKTRQRLAEASAIRARKTYGIEAYASRWYQGAHSAGHQLLCCGDATDLSTWSNIPISYCRRGNLEES